MLSIIISSYQPHYFSALEKNIAETIGIPYEIIKIDNPGKVGICEAYNSGASKANFDYLLFLHEDAEFRTVNWGKHLVNSLNQKNAGVIGVLGSDYIPNVPFAWWDLYENNFSHYTQFENNKLIGDYNLTEDKNVKIIDGVFMAVKNTVFNKFKFNEKIQGYHGYDVVFSANVAAEYQNLVTSKIKIAHFSYALNGLNKDWMDTMIRSRRLYTMPADQLTNKKKELFSFLQFYSYLKKFSYSKTETVALLIKYAEYSKIGLHGLRVAGRLIFKEILMK